MDICSGRGFYRQFCLDIPTYRMNRTFLYLPILLMLAGCAVHPKQPFDPRLTPPAPDYALLANWAAHPDLNDPADQTPCPYVRNMQDSAVVDVFFLHPTTYTGASRDQRDWNASAADAGTNEKTDNTTILFQASIFNGAGRIYAPRYRQAHLNVFFGKDTSSARQALNVAYEDVKTAFRYYLEHWNAGRPFIIAAHSQGSRHALFLLKEMVEGTPLQKQLVAAYIVGWPVREGFFAKLQPCRTPEETGCFCSWRTWERRFALKHAFERDVICTNPLDWTIGEGRHVPKSANMGGVIRPFCSVIPNIADAEVYKGVLLCSRPRFPGSFLFRTKNYHVGDLNLYYMNVRENAEERVERFLEDQ